MDAKQAADIIKSGNINPADFQELYAALEGKTEFAEAFNELRKQMLQSYAKGDSIEVNQSGAAGRDDVLTVDQSDKRKENIVKQGQNIEPWKVQTRNDILQWAAKVKTHETPEVKASEEGLHAEFKDGTQVSFVAENHVSVKTPDAPKAQNFDMVVALAKKNHKKVKLGENMTPEFRTALIEACAKANVQISNLSLEDLDAYMKFLPKKQQKLNVVEQKTDGKTAERQVRTTTDVSENKTADVQPQKPVVDNGIGNILSAVAAHAAARETSESNKQKTETAGNEPVSPVVNRGHSLSHLTPEQLGLLHEKGFEVDVYSHVNDAQFAAINAALSGAEKTAKQDEPYTIRVHHGHSLGGLSDVELEVLHNSGFEVDRFSHVDDATWAQIQKALNKKDKADPVQQPAVVTVNDKEKADKGRKDAPQSTVVTVDDKKKADKGKKDAPQATVVTVNDKEKADKGKKDAPQSTVVTVDDKEKADKGRKDAPQSTVVTVDDKEKADKGRKDAPQSTVVTVDDKEKADKGKKDAPQSTVVTVDDKEKADKGRKDAPQSAVVTVDDKEKGDKGKKDAPQAVVVTTGDKEKGDKEGKQKGNTPAAAIVVPDQKQGASTSTDKGAPAKPAKKEGFLSGLWSKVKRNAKKVALIATVAVVSFFGGRSCSGNLGGNAGSDKDDLPKNKTENVILANPTDSLVTEITPVDTLATPDYEWVDAPAKWNSGMSITEAQFNNMYNIIHKHSPDGALWDRMYNNANKNAERFGQPDALSFMFKAMRAAAWTNALNGKICETHGAHWASTYSGAFGNVVGPMIGVIKCDDNIDAETLAKAKIMLNAVDGNGRLNVFTLDQLVPGTSRYNDHDTQGLIIGKNRNVMVDINDDCADSKVGFRMGGTIQQRRIVKPDPVVITEPGDTIHRKLPDVVITEPGDTIRRKLPDVVITEPGDTIRNKPAPVVINEQPQGRVAVGSRANLSDRPGAEGVSHASAVRQNGSDTGLTGEQKKQVLKMAREALKAGRIDQAAYDAIVAETKGTGQKNTSVKLSRDR